MEKPLNRVEINPTTGHYELYDLQGNHVLTMIHPVQIGDTPITSEKIKEFKSDVELHRNASLLLHEMERVLEDLNSLKKGKISIFDFPIDSLINNCTFAIKKATNID